MAFQQAQAEGLCLRYSEHIPPQREITYDSAVNFLVSAVQASQNVPYVWSFVDKPPDGQVYLLFLARDAPFPLDGLHYQDQETRFTINVGGHELEIQEVKYGFIPGSSDTTASRLRRRYRFTKGPQAQIVLVHYTRGPAVPILPALMNQPARNYPLRVVNEPSVFVMGDKARPKFFPQQGGGVGGVGGGGGGGGGMGGPVQQMPPGGGPMGMGGMPSQLQIQSQQQQQQHQQHQQQQQVHQQQQQMAQQQMRQGGGGGPVPPGMNMGMPMGAREQHAMVVQQNNNMEMLERRRESQRARERSTSTANRPPRPEEDDSGDELDQISTRNLAMNRYRRNHEIMNEVFNHAAFGNKKTPQKPSPYSIFDLTDIENRSEKLRQELSILSAKTAQNKSALTRAEQETAEQRALASAASVRLTESSPVDDLSEQEKAFAGGGGGGGVGGGNDVLMREDFVVV